MTKNAKDEYFKRGYGKEFRSPDNSQIARLYDPIDLALFEQDFNNNRETLFCNDCSEEFIWVKKRGKKPKICPECRKKKKAENARKYFEQIKVSGKYSEDKRELLKMFYIMRTYKKKINHILEEAVELDNRDKLEKTTRVLGVFLDNFEKWLGDK